jgi:hypothetical protein
MPRREEDQPNCELPASMPFHSEGQFWRVQVPFPDTRLLLGQRVSASPARGPAFGYPGVTLTTQAGFFADIREPTVWQGHDVIAFQAKDNTELHSGHAVVLGATKWKDDHEPNAGDHLGRTHGQTRLYGQLRDQAIGLKSASLVRGALGIVKTLLNYPLARIPEPHVLIKSGLKAGVKKLGGVALDGAGEAAKAIPKDLGLAAGVAGLASNSQDLKTLTPAEVEPEPGVHISSHDGIFLASNGSTNVLAAQGYSLISGTSFSAHAALTASLSATLAVDVFALGTASMSSMWSSEVSAWRNASLIAKNGEAAVIGKTVQIGRILPGKEAAIPNIPSWVPKAGGTSLALNRTRPTNKLTLEAVKSIEANVGGKFVINSPIGEVSSTSRKANVKAAESITLETPFGKVEVTVTGISISGPTASVKVNLATVDITAGASTVQVSPAGVTLRSPGANVQVMPGGIVNVQGTLIKLG